MKIILNKLFLIILFILNVSCKSGSNITDPPPINNSECIDGQSMGCDDICLITPLQYDACGVCGGEGFSSGFSSTPKAVIDILSTEYNLLRHDHIFDGDPEYYDDGYWNRSVSQIKIINTSGEEYINYQVNTNPPLDSFMPNNESSGVELVTSLNWFSESACSKEFPIIISSPLFNFTLK